MAVASRVNANVSDERSGTPTTNYQIAQTSQRDPQREARALPRRLGGLRPQPFLTAASTAAP